MKTMIIMNGIGTHFEGNVEAIALREALVKASGASGFTVENNEIIYDWLADIPKASLCIELARALTSLGYTIKKTE